MWADALDSPYLCVDATGVLVQHPDKCKKGHFFVVAAPERHVLFVFAQKQQHKLIVDEFEAWCDVEALQVLDEAPLATAIQYARNQRAALRTFLEHGRVPLDSNWSERELRRIAWADERLCPTRRVDFTRTRRYIPRIRPSQHGTIACWTRLGQKGCDGARDSGWLDLAANHESRIRGTSWSGSCRAIARQPRVAEQGRSRCAESSDCAHVSHRQRRSLRRRASWRRGSLL